MEHMIAGLNKAGAAYGVQFNPFEVMPNTRLALAASEFARDNGKYDRFSDVLFKALFLEGQNIGQLQTVLACARKVGLDEKSLTQALTEEKYIPRLHKARELGKKYDVAGLPTFIINNNKKIVGAQPYQTFVHAIQQAMQNKC